ncbi:bifunctional diaminohydroxyphosphoribosylaminopyrimidine deaminase/5-amino-6-(5-phosphoribosylamino)uracil reductase RibD [Dendrosporobacter sp. 1207_IL3150]|uniref:bifunctional diaminohydroxyphosphoribosylaminopyrimidine deaminase/5-amino-6-(5-phosphoribosylamino)uracil reductase RibD n=1 Tax=Dendrosporobacter sp. 1207_IL3150 TaxID=3084054 RepID=UPI002FD8F53F
MDEQYMRQALHISQYAIGRTSPNPLVGAVIVKDGRVVGQGWHKQAGTPHAEIHALAQAGELSKGSTIYVTLEPCSHHGRTGPCTDALINAGIARAVIAMTDPNPLVAGKGIEKLRDAGIRISEGVLAADAAKINEVFLKWISCKIPFVALKTAMTLDGKIATHTGNSKWITGAKSRQRVHEYRDTYDAIMTGVGTVIEDNPELTTRLETKGKNPTRIIVDSKGRIPLNSKIITDKSAPTIIAVTAQAAADKIKSLEAEGIEVIIVSEKNGRVDLSRLLRELGNRRLTSILLEGGAELNASMLNENLVDKIHCFIAPKIIGGSSAPGPVGGQGVATLDYAYLLEDINSEVIDDDILITAYLRNREGRDVYRTCGRIG